MLRLPLGLSRKLDLASAGHRHLSVIGLDERSEGFEVPPVMFRRGLCRLLFVSAGLQLGHLLVDRLFDLEHAHGAVTAGVKLLQLPHEALDVACSVAVLELVNNSVKFLFEALVHEKLVAVLLLQGDYLT